MLAVLRQFDAGEGRMLVVVLIVIALAIAGVMVASNRLPTMRRTQQQQQQQIERDYRKAVEACEKSADCSGRR